MRFSYRAQTPEASAEWGNRPGGTNFGSPKSAWSAREWLAGLDRRSHQFSGPDPGEGHTAKIFILVRIRCQFLQAME